MSVDVSTRGEWVSLLRNKPHFTPGERRTPYSLSAFRKELILLTSWIEHIDELTRAYETSLQFQKVLRPLISTTTWCQAADAVWQHGGNWPVQELTATIMFTDIAGFASLMETHPVREVLGSLNDYLALLSQIVQRHRGDVHKFLGDGLMALFICPADAVSAACEIQRAVAAFNNRQESLGRWRFETRLAIDTGDLILASVGAPNRQDYTLIGRPVNQAAHLSERATPGSVWISQGTYDKLVNRDGFAPRTVLEARHEEGPPLVYEMALDRMNMASLNQEILQDDGGLEPDLRSRISGV